MKRHSSAKFGNTRLRPQPAWPSRTTVLRPGHQSPRVWKGPTPDDQKRLIPQQNSPRETGSVEDLRFFKAVLILLPAPFEGRSLFHMGREASLAELERRGPVKGEPASFKGPLNVFRRLPQVSISWKVKQKSAGGRKGGKQSEKPGVTGVLRPKSALMKHLSNSLMDPKG